MHIHLHALVAAVFTLGHVAGCNRPPAQTSPRYGAEPAATSTPGYTLAVHPLHNPARLLQAYSPLVAHLNSQIGGTRIALEASRDYATFESKYRARRVELLLPNPWQALQAMSCGYHVIAMAGQPEDFKGLLLVRRDRPLASPADLKGLAVSYPSPTALAACIMPQTFLHEHGLNVMVDLDNRYVGSQESAIMNVYLGLTAAGATWPPPWRLFQQEHPREAAELMVKWETAPLVNNAVMARDDLPPPLVAQLRTTLLELDQTAAGKAILAHMEIARFLPATDASYEVVRQYVAHFERAIRPVEQP